MQFSAFNPWPFLLAGLFDSVSPCAITVLVFFVSVIFFYGFKGKSLFCWGLGFIIAAFITALFLEAGTFESFRQLELFYLLSKVVYLIIAVVALMLGVMLMREWWLEKNGQLKGQGFLKLGALGNETNIGVAKVLVGALISGFILMVLESYCRGQLYFPTMISLMAADNKILQAAIYVLFYNIVSLWLLLTVFGFMASFQQRKQFKEMLENKLSKIRIISSAVFFALGLGLIFLFR